MPTIISMQLPDEIWSSDSWVLNHWQGTQYCLSYDMSDVLSVRIWWMHCLCWLVWKCHLVVYQEIRLWLFVFRHSKGHKADVFWMCSCSIICLCNLLLLAYMSLCLGVSVYLDRMAIWAAVSWIKFTTVCCSCLQSSGPMLSPSSMHLTFPMHFCAVCWDAMTARFMNTSTTGLLAHLLTKHRRASIVQTSLTAGIGLCVVTCEMKLFQNYFRSLLQLMNIFQHVQCHWNNLEIISAAEIILF